MLELFLISFAFDPTVFKTQKPMFWPKRVNLSFTLNLDSFLEVSKPCHKYVFRKLDFSMIISSSFVDRIRGPQDLVLLVSKFTWKGPTFKRYLYSLIFPHYSSLKNPKAPAVSNPRPREEESSCSHLLLP